MRKYNSSLKTAFVSEAGSKLTNKDYFGFVELDNFACYVIADGITDKGDADGARIAIEAIIQAFQEEPGIGKGRIKGYLKRANEVLLKGESDEKLKASLTVVVTDYVRLRFGYVGNTRFRIYRQGRCLFTTNDMSLALSVEDGIRLPYLGKLENTNALLISGGKELCGIFSLQKKKGDQAHLYLIKAQEMFCRESAIKDYDLYCFPKEESDRLYALYEGKETGISTLTGYRIPLLDVEVRTPIPLRMPLVIDFGSTNTTAGVYLDSVYVEQAKGAPFAEKLTKNSIHYTRFSHGEKLLPSVAGVLSVEEGKPQFVFGQEAVDMANACYVDEGFSIFYDMKRWISDYERQEEITDRQGKRAFLPRKEIIKAYFSHIITQTENQFKCKVSQLHVSCPVRQKYLFGRLFQEILPDLLPKEEEMLDEGVAVVYNTLSGLLETGKLMENQEYQALIVDCGGGTTDLCACTFRVQDTGISYHVQMDTAYENGDTDFGGNNLTYRIMQLIKVTLVEQSGYPLTMSTEEILKPPLDFCLLRRGIRLVKMQYGADSCRQKFHLFIAVGLAVVKVKHLWTSVLGNSGFDDGHQIYKVVIKEDVNSHNKAAGIINQGDNVNLVLLSVRGFQVRPHAGIPTPDFIDMWTFIAAHVTVDRGFQFKSKMVDKAVNGGFGNLTGDNTSIVMKLSEDCGCRHAGIILFEIFNLFL